MILDYVFSKSGAGLSYFCHHGLMAGLLETSLLYLLVI